MQRFFILFDIREATYGVKKTIIRGIVVYGAYLSNQNLSFPRFAIKTVVNPLCQTNTFAWFQYHFVIFQMMLDAINVYVDSASERASFSLDAYSSNTRFPPPRLIMSSILLQWKCIGVS